MRMSYMAKSQSTILFVDENKEFHKNVPVALMAAVFEQLSFTKGFERVVDLKGFNILISKDDFFDVVNKENGFLQYKNDDISFLLVRNNDVFRINDGLDEMFGVIMDSGNLIVSDKIDDLVMPRAKKIKVS